MLELIINIAAVFGAFWFSLLAYIGFRVVIHAFLFATQVGIAHSRAFILDRASQDVRDAFNEDAEKQAAEADAKKKAAENKK